MNLSSPLSGVLRDLDAAVLVTLRRVTGGLTGRRIEALTAATSRSALLSSLGRLQAIGLIERVDVGNAAVYSLNRGHLLWKGLDAMLSSSAIIESEVVAMVRRMYPDDSTTVAVFGSVARGDSDASSDLDIALVFAGDLDGRRDELVGMIEREVPRRTGNVAQVIDIDIGQLRTMVVAADPLIDSWRRDARTIGGADLARLIEEAAR